MIDVEIDGVIEIETAELKVVEIENQSISFFSGSASVTSVFGRTGVVVAASNDYTWAQIDKTTSDLADITTKSHTSLTDIGTNTHAQIDTHIASVTEHPFTRSGTLINPVTSGDDVEWDNFKYVDATTGGTNCIIVGNTGNTTNSGTGNFLFGTNAGNAITSGSFNFALGNDSLFMVTTLSDNVAIGDSSLKNVTTQENVGIGSDAGVDQTGSKSVNVGYRAGGKNTGFAVFMGHDAGQNSVSQQVVGIGNNALLNNTATGSTAVGYTAGNANTSGRLTAFGSKAGALNTTGFNTFIGFECGRSNVGGSSNCYVGEEAGETATGSNNSFFGRQAGQANTGSTNTFYGRQAGSASGAASGCVYLGYNAGKSDTTSNRLIIGNTSSSQLIYGEFDNNIVKVNGTFGTPKTDSTLGAAATAIAVTSNVMTITGDGGANTVATITGGVDGQLLTMIFVDALVTITDTAASTADTVNLSAAFTSAANTTIQLVFDNNKWFEVSRSVN